LVRKLKSENAPAPDVEVAIKELKVRKKALENKVFYSSFNSQDKFLLIVILCIAIREKDQIRYCLGVGKFPDSIVQLLLSLHACIC